MSRWIHHSTCVEVKGCLCVIKQKPLILKSTLTPFSFFCSWLVYSFLCMRVHGCIMVYMYECAGTCRSQNSTSGVGTQSPSSWPKAHSVNLGWLASLPQESTFPMLKLERYAPTMGFLCGFQIRNPGHYVCAANTLPISSQVLDVLFNQKIIITTEEITLQH